MNKKEEIKEILKGSYPHELERFISSVEHYLKQGLKFGYVNQDGNISFKIQDWPEPWERTSKFFLEDSDNRLPEWSDEFIEALNELVTTRLLESHVVRELHGPVIRRDGYTSHVSARHIVGTILRFTLKVRL